jgi:hypothetical protein
MKILNFHFTMNIEEVDSLHKQVFDYAKYVFVNYYKASTPKENWTPDGPLSFTLYSHGASVKLENWYPTPHEKALYFGLDTGNSVFEAFEPLSPDQIERRHFPDRDSPDL